MGEKQTMGRSTDEVMAAVQAKRKAELSEEIVAVDTVETKSLLGVLVTIGDRLRRKIVATYIPGEGGKVCINPQDDTPAPLPTDEQIASLLQENERLQEKVTRLKAQNKVLRLALADTF